MTVEVITAVELNAVEKLIVNAEAGRAGAVPLDARTARALFETYKRYGDPDGGGQQDDLADELAGDLRRAEDRVRELETKLRDEGFDPDLV